MDNSKSPDFVISGAGIVGTAISVELKRRFPAAKVLVLEKEATGFAHSSGRNSGVIHAGFYYPPESLKAKMTSEGNRRLTGYCKEKGIRLLECGKLVVAQNEREDKMLDILFERGKKNNSDIEMLSLNQAREIEPRVNTFNRALWSPKTKVADPISVLENLQLDAKAMGVQFEFGSQVIGKIDSNTLQTSQGIVKGGYFINSSGLQADIIAHSFGFGENYKILPFKGLYLYSTEQAPQFRTNIYPVPDLKYPFLGVHITLALDGRSKLGPTAIPAFWREQYKGLQNFTLNEFSKIMARHGLFVLYNGRHFAKMAVEEFRKYNASFMVKKALPLATGIKTEQYKTWGKPGIRAQLINVRTKKLEMDFIMEGDRHSLHILNAVSPGWTCSFPFADFVCNQIESFQSAQVPNEKRHLKESNL